MLCFTFVAGWWCSPLVNNNPAILIFLYSYPCGWWEFSTNFTVSIFPVVELPYLPAVTHPVQPQWCHTALQVSEAAQHSSWTLYWDDHGRLVREGFQHPAPGEMKKLSNPIPNRDLRTPLRVASNYHCMNVWNTLSLGVIYLHYISCICSSNVINMS